MLSTIKTPGVYINEVDAFPSSIAQVKTAVPAFIGYTQKGPTVPVKVRSLLEYTNRFGVGAPPENINADFTVDESKFKLFNSLGLFFANGGGECFIVSVGDYSNTDFDATARDAFIAKLNLLEHEDEPTLLLFPDTINFSSSNLKDIQRAALAQCADLKDRFTILDIKEITADVNKSKLDQSVDQFRDDIGTRDLKYGAAYYPSLQAQFPNKFRFSDINKTFEFKVTHASNTELKEAITDFETLHADVETINDEWNTLNKTKEKIKFTDPFADKITTVDSYYVKLWELLAVLKNPSTIAHGTDPKTGLQDLVNEDIISISLKKYAQKLLDFKDYYDGLKDSENDDFDDLVFDTSIFEPIWGTLDGSEISNSNFYNLETIGNAVPLNFGPDGIEGNADDIPAHQEPSFEKIQGQLDKLHNQIINAMNSAMASIEDFELVLENNLTAQIPEYSDIITKLNKNMNIVPPSGAVAGIYAQVDATRGVWKAPANISINGIESLTDDINDKTQAEMNIHETGKSINAIRKFTGKGQLIWGARTLAGNSNDWRFVSVRRLANMIEESVKKACMDFVFEPNVKRTWVNVKGMIENYLSSLWSDGALVGAKPEKSFFVSVGTETMSDQDILEGKMIVKIGYRPSRTAEFIILEFKQMQQKS